MPRDMFRLGYSVRMEAEGGDTAEVMLYGQIIEDMPEAWKWSKEDKSAAEFDKAIKEVRKKGAKKLLLRINSPGGVCTESVAMRAILAGAGFEEINIRIEGLCASAATDIATLPGAHVVITEGSEYMVHNPWMMVAGNANELEQYIERLRNIEQTSRAFYAKRSGQSDEQIKAWMDAETWFTAEQAVQYGFADEVLEADLSGELPAVACVSSKAMAAMRRLYKSVPEQIMERADDEAAHESDVSNGAPVAGEPSEINHEEEHDNMDIKDINVDQLRAENPALLETIQQNALAAERQRIEDIESLTLPGYEAMADAAKKAGTSALEFQQQVVKAQREKGNAYLAARRDETEAAKAVSGHSAEEEADSEEAQIKKLQEEAKGYAAVMHSENETMY